jgi:two-component system response regulator YesN
VGLDAGEADRAAGELEQEIKMQAGLRGHVIFDAVVKAGKMFAVRIGVDADADLLRGFEERCSLIGSVRGLFDYLRGFQREQITIVRERLENEAIRPIRIAKQYIEQHYNRQITLDDVCAAIGFSVSYFSTIFKRETGEGFSKYLTRVRMERAKELLQETNLPVSEICELIGYNDIKHFTGAFKKMTSLSPGQYRKLYSH